MGLDMYLEKDIYVGGQYEHRNVTGKIEIQINGKPLNISLNQIDTITERVGYWRKANAIHKWFVDNVQDGVDECQRSYVECEKLKELHALVVEALAHPKKSQEILPTQSGFFFGNTEYGEDYKEDLKTTKEILENIFKDKEWDTYDYYYQSSW